MTEEGEIRLISMDSPGFKKTSFSKASSPIDKSCCFCDQTSYIQIPSTLVNMIFVTNFFDRSPVHPDNYFHDSNCTWIVTAPPGKVVEIKWADSFNFFVNFFNLIIPLLLPGLMCCS